ncbi:MAG: WD40 repeat domain-containing protein [Chloroflexota bacterium]
MRFIKSALAWWGCVAVALLAACAPAPTVPTATPARSEPEPTIPPPEWQEPFTPVTGLNVSNVQLVGRLDSPGGNTGSIFSHAFSIDGTRLATMNTAQLIVWNLLTGETVFAAGRGEATDVYFSPDKTELYIFNRDGLLDILDGETGANQTFITTHPDFIDGNAYAYDPQNGLLAVVAVQGEIRIWNVQERLAVGNIQLETAEITSLVLSDEPGRVAAGNEAGMVEVWDWQADERLASLQTDSELSVRRMDFSSTGEQIAVANDEDIHVWNTASGTLQHILLTGQGGSADVLTFTPDDIYIINSGIAEAMNIWDAETGELEAAIQELGGEPTAVDFSPQDNLMLASVFQGQVSVWDIDTISDTGIVSTRLPVDTSIIDVGWSPDRRALALFDTQGSVYIWGIPERIATTEEPGGE